MSEGPSNDYNTVELLDTEFTHRSTFRRKLKSLIAGLFGPSPAHERLVGELAIYEIERDYLIGRPEGDVASRWETDGERCLEAARTALNNYETELGWRFLYAARRLELIALAEDDPEAFQARVQTTKREAVQKLDNWRQEAVEDLLGGPDDAIENVDVTDAHLATLLLQEHYDTYHQKVQIHRRQLWWLVGSAGLVIALVLLIAGTGGPLLEGVAVTSPRFQFAVVLFGVLGAAISGILSLAHSSIDSRLSQQVLSSWVTYARLVLGAASALVMLAFLTSGLATLVMQDVVLTPGFVLFVAFAAGFSERLLVRAIESVSGETESSPKPT